MSRKTIEHKIQELRDKMIYLAEKKKDLLDEEVIAISQELDKFIFVLQRQKLNKNHHTLILRSIEKVLER